MEKKRDYGDGVRSMEHGSFTPLVFSMFSDLGREATVFYSRLANLPSKKQHTRHFLYCVVVFSSRYFT